MIARSLAPARSCSRTWFLRSIASSACESAMVWFWHTRQRSTSAIAIARRSSSGSAAAGSASFAAAETASASNSSATIRLRTAFQLLDQRQDLFLHDLGREDADALVADHAALVDHICLGNAVDAVVYADASVAIIGGELIRIAHRREPAQ